MINRIFILMTLIVLALWGVTACTTPAQSDVQNQSAVTIAPSLATTASEDVSAIQNVIQKANQEQVQAVAAKNPTLMQDTAMTNFYQQSVQTLNDLLNLGVTSIQLVDLNWGPITQTDASTAQATTYETWSTTFSDGSTMKETNTNVYTMVLQNGSWKVQDDQHPNNQPSPSTSPSGATSPETPVAPADAATGQTPSRNWSGYVASGGTFTAVSGMWTVPNVSAGTSGMDATWIGIGGVDATDLIQAGTQATVESGQVVYSAIWETLPQAAQFVPLTIKAGDQMSVSITQQDSGAWQISIKDATSGQSWAKSVTYSSSLSSAEWIEEAPATGRFTILPLDSFGSVTFSSATTVENGQTRTIAQANAEPITMNNGTGQALAQASNIDASGTSFTVIRTSVAAGSVIPFRHRRPGG
jgi:peptidase A4-like protein